MYVLQGLKKSHPRNNHLLGLFGIAWGRTSLCCPLLLPDLLKGAGCKTIAVHLTPPHQVLVSQRQRYIGIIPYPGFPTCLWKGDSSPLQAHRSAGVLDIRRPYTACPWPSCFRHSFVLMLLRGEQFKIFLLCYMCCEGGSKYEQKMFLVLVAIGGKLHFSLQVFIPVVKGDMECWKCCGVGVPLSSKVFRFDSQTQLYTPHVLKESSCWENWSENSRVPSEFEVEPPLFGRE